MELLLNPSLFSLLPLLLFIIFLFKRLYTSPTCQRKLPPSPPKLPVIGNLHQVGSLPHRSLRSLSQKYGPLMLLHFGSVPVLVASSAEAACEIMKSHDIVFSTRPKSNISDKLTYGSKDIAFSPYGEYWRRVRSICVNHLLSNQRVKSFRHVIEEETKKMIENINERCVSSSSPVNLSDFTLTLTNSIICTIAFGRKHCDVENMRKIKAMLMGFEEILSVFDAGDYIPWLAWVNRFTGLDAKLKTLAKQGDELVEGVIDAHMKRKKAEAQSYDAADQAKGTDFMDILLDIYQGTVPGFALDRDSVKAIILDMFTAGTDTIYTSIDWTIAELLRHPRVLKKLHTEVRQVAQGKSEITEEDLGKMEYLKVVIKETLRLHPPIPLLLPRESTQEISIMGYHILAGTQVIVNAWAIGRDPLYWENPEEFRPERFMGSDMDFRGFNFEYTPFGAGRRSCPALAFAIAVVELTIAKLVQRFDFALPDEAKPEDLDMTEASGTTVHKQLPIVVNVVATRN
uniref:Norfluorocurarine oxidase n=1 Tax=Strychnos sp. TaxID=2946199 RepID=NO_STRYX|nr:norfluorocurarine oxidase [Strychnos sp.]